MSPAHGVTTECLRTEHLGSHALQKKATLSGRLVVHVMLWGGMPSDFVELKWTP